MSTSTFAVVQPKRRALDPGALRPLVDSYFDHLVSQGYRESTLGHFGYIVRHFCYWLNQAKIAVAEVNDGVVKKFAAHRCKCPGNRPSQTISAPSISGVRKFIAFLEQTQVIHRPAAPLGDDRLHAYVEWLRQHRGSSETTISGYRDIMNQLLPRLGPDPRKYDAALVRGVIIAEFQRRSSVDMKRYVTALRSYLRFLITQDQCAPTLDQAVPGVRHSTYSNIPKFLPATTVEKLINSCDTATPAGIRDRAVLLLLARLGLRAGDIVTLRIDDIDWQHGTLRVCGKERREATLPLPQDAGDALLRYLTEARPDASFDRVFLHSKAPRQPFCRWTTVGKIVRRALVRAGIDDAPAHGAHLLRHSAAAMLLQAGAPLATIGTVLRHRSVSTTARQGRFSSPQTDRPALARRCLVLSQDVERYVTSKRALGYKFTYPAYSLKRFADYATAHGDQFIRVERVLAWVTSETPSAARRCRLVARVRRFALDMQAEDPRHEVPPRDCFGRAKYIRKSPYIYTADEIERILCVAHQMPREGIIAPLTLATLLGLLASTGLRISEAMALQCSDLTDDGLLIRKSKNNRTRLIPLHETTRAALEKYLSERARQPVHTQALFVSRKGQGLQHAVVWCAFLRLLARTGIRPMSSYAGPRLHDLRHTFAVRSLEQCQNDRRAVAQHMIALSTYLGHTNVADTYWYLEATAPLLRSIAEAGEAMHRGGDV